MEEVLHAYTDIITHKHSWQSVYLKEPWLFSMCHSHDEYSNECHDMKEERGDRICLNQLLYATSTDHNGTQYGLRCNNTYLNILKLCLLTHQQDNSRDRRPEFGVETTEEFW